MLDGVRKFIADCAGSTVGRLAFVGYLIYITLMIGSAHGHFPYLAYPYFFYGERELFELLNAPQLALIRSSRLIVRWQASGFTDALAAVYIALPWWVYGHLFERIAKRIMDRGEMLTVGQQEVEKLVAATEHLSIESKYFSRTRRVRS
jgi:hypothetical protein